MPENSGKPVDAATVATVHLISLVTTSPVTVRTGESTASKAAPGQLLVEWELTWLHERWFTTSFIGNEYVPPTP